MHHIHGLSIAHCRTNEFLENEKFRLLDSSYIDFLKKSNKYLNREYGKSDQIIVSLSDIQFEKELVLNLGGITAKISHTESPHSEDTVLIYVPEKRILFLGD